MTTYPIKFGRWNRVTPRDGAATSPRRPPHREPRPIPGAVDGRGGASSMPPTTYPRRRVGRPGGPTPGRGRRPYDPKRLSPKDMKALGAIFDHRDELERGEILRCDLAASIGVSPAYLSKIKNCALGQAVLRRWSEQDGEDPERWSRL